MWGKVNVSTVVYAHGNEQAKINRESLRLLKHVENIIEEGQLTTKTLI